MWKSMLLLALSLAPFVASRAEAQVPLAPLRPTTAIRPGVGLVGPVRVGPYATLSRANAVARYYRLSNYNARVVLAGSPSLGARGYAVIVWR